MHNLYEVLSHLGDGIYVLDSSSKIVYINEAAMKMLGYSREEIMSQNAHNLFHVECNGESIPEEECSIRHVIANGETYINHRECFRRKDGTILHVSITSTLFEDEHGGVALTVFRDIGLEESLAAKSRFISKISHELRTPLNAMINFTDQVLEDFDEIAGDPEMRQESRQYLERAVHNAKKLHEMIEELIRYTMEGEENDG